MQSFSLSHLSDSSLDRELESAAHDASIATAWLLAHLAESDARRRHVPAGFPSMFEYCVRHLRFSEDAAYKRIRVARAARQFPAIFRMIAEGRLHLTGVLMLAPHLTTANAAELLAAATHQPKSEIERLIACKFPRPDVPELVVALTPAVRPGGQERHIRLAPERVGMTMSGQAPSSDVPMHAAETLQPPALDEGPPRTMAPERSEPPQRPRITALAPERFSIQCTVSRATHDHLRRAQELLAHAIPAASVEAVLGRALALLVRDLERRKHAATDRPRKSRPVGEPRNPRYIPAEVKRAVSNRDGGRCTFVAANGRRCEARGGLEYDHEIPVARNGRSTTGNLRLRCRAHNQLEAEQAFGAEFMRQRRESGREGGRAAPRLAPATG